MPNALNLADHSKSFLILRECARWLVYALSLYDCCLEWASRASVMTEFSADSVNIATIKLILTIISGLCWTAVYIEGIRVGLKDQSYAIPFYALALNLAWELLYTFYGFRTSLSVQTIVNATWFLFDVGILYTYLKYGRKYFPRHLPMRAFIAWTLLILITALFVQYAFVREFGVRVGAGYSAFLQNLLMSVLFIIMFVRRGGNEGQSLSIATNKWIGTLAPTIQYGILGDGGFPNGSFLILTAGIFCSVFDLIYIRMLLATRSKAVIS